MVVLTIKNSTIDCPSENLNNANDFTIAVSGNNVNPSSTFPGSESGTVVTMQPGLFDVTESLTNPQTDITSPAPAECDNVIGAPFDAGADLGNNQFICTIFDGTCSANMMANDELTCTIENTIALLEQILWYKKIGLFVIIFF